MNFGRGLFRFWLVVSIVWAVIVGFWVYASFQAFLAIARSFGITGSDWTVILLALAIPIGFGLLLCLVFVWVLRGFRA